jgi:hypothetical protein
LTKITKKNKSKISRQVNNNNEEIFSIYSFTKEDENMMKQTYENNKNMIGGYESNNFAINYMHNKKSYIELMKKCIYF